MIKKIFLCSLVALGIGSVRCDFNDPEEDYLNAWRGEKPTQDEIKNFDKNAEYFKVFFEGLYQIVSGQSRRDAKLRKEKEEQRKKDEIAAEHARLREIALEDAKKRQKLLERLEEEKKEKARKAEEERQRIKKEDEEKRKKQEEEQVRKEKELKKASPFGHQPFPKSNVKPPVQQKKNDGGYGQYLTTKNALIGGGVLLVAALIIVNSRGGSNF